MVWLDGGLSPPNFVVIKHGFAISSNTKPTGLETIYAFAAKPVQNQRPQITPGMIVMEVGRPQCGPLLSSSVTSFLRHIVFKLQLGCFVLGLWPKKVHLPQVFCFFVLERPRSIDWPAFLQCVNVQTLHPTYPQFGSSSGCQWFCPEAWFYQASIACWTILLYSLRPCLVAYGCLFPFSPHELRGMLLQMQIFGAVDVSSSDPAAWKTALNNAFDDFTRWRKRHRVSCSQKRFKFRMLVRDEYGFCLNAKGYNARVIAEWLLFKLCDIQSNPVVGMVPDDRADLCEIAMKPGGCLWSTCSFYFIFGTWETFHSQSSSEFQKALADWYYLGFLSRSLPKPQVPHNHLRRGVCRYFGLTERACRFLLLGLKSSMCAGGSWLRVKHL